jgi:thiol-disulfide isomerase/thioredoxin
MPETQVVLYTAAYCPYCQDFKPTWEQFVKEGKTYLKE